MNPSYSISHRTRLGCSTKRLSRRGVFEFKSRLFRFAACALALAFAWCAPPVGAEDFTQGELEGSLDITLSHGVTLRVGDRDKRLIGRAEGAGTANSVNSDDGNLNYDSGIVSNASKFIGELDLNYRNFGAFARVHGFFDFENDRGERARSELSPEAKDLVGKDFEVLDLYLTGSFDLGGAAVDLRLGNHVISWGESTFIQNSINVINPFDVTKLRTPGAELRDGLVPVPMVSVSASLNESLSVEGFYQVKWEKTEIDPPGSYFSTSDFAGAGGRRVVLGWGAVPDTGRGLGPITAAVNADLRGFHIPSPAAPGTLVPLPQRAQPDFDTYFLNVFRRADEEPEDSGQWGVALRYLAEGLNNTEFGFYFVNYHSRLPVLSGRTGTAQGVADGLFALGAVARGSATTGAIAQAVTPAVTQAVTQQVTAAVTEHPFSPARRLRRFRRRSKGKSPAGYPARSPVRSPPESAPYRRPPRHRSLREDGGLHRRIPGRHPASGRELQHPARNLGLGAAGRTFPPHGRALADRRRRTFLRLPDAAHRRRSGRTALRGHESFRLLSGTRSPPTASATRNTSKATSSAT